jgi:hypothetical protein
MLKSSETVNAVDKRQRQAIILRKKLQQSRVNRLKRSGYSVHTQTAPKVIPAGKPACGACARRR